ncbi:MAG: type II toxin-antitoxin system VapC family toxin [Acidobacteriia bacterium]|nr:type II toxin-antitoxin system VapC family toxin [Terriglobia bacterium]
MNFLADTHVLIWWFTGSEQLSRKVRNTMSHRTAVLWVSAVSVWEMAIKTGKGHLELDLSLQEIIAIFFKEGWRSLPITIEHALAVQDLPLIHKDPFDRMLVAQAQSEGLTLVTADPKISAYDVRTIDASL